MYPPEHKRNPGTGWQAETGAGISIYNLRFITSHPGYQPKPLILALAKRTAQKILKEVYAPQGGWF